MHARIVALAAATAKVVEGPRRVVSHSGTATRHHRCLAVCGLARHATGVIRKAFRMQVDKGHEAEYERRHRPIWQQLEDTLLSHGVRTYSIYLDPKTGDLFGYVECESEASWKAIAETDVCQRWWRFMRDIMPSNGDNSPVSHDLCEVFHIESR
jgi:L-rhamnose mutarotase